jgi:glycosyltransferase involved in cell wall biosynthesis
MDEHLLSLVVPAFNEERTIETVLDRIFEFLPEVHEVLVIDDASVDRTPELSHAYGERERLDRNATEFPSRVPGSEGIPENT